MTHKQIMDNFKDLIGSNKEAHSAFHELGLTAHPSKTISHQQGEKIVRTLVKKFGNDLKGHTSGKERIRKNVLKEIERSQTENKPKTGHVFTNSRFGKLGAWLTGGKVKHRDKSALLTKKRESNRENTTNSSPKIGSTKTNTQQNNTPQIESAETKLNMNVENQERTNMDLSKDKTQTPPLDMFGSM